MEERGQMMYILEFAALCGAIADHPTIRLQQLRMRLENIHYPPLHCESKEKTRTTGPWPIPAAAARP
jgi:hypothetical protein